MVPKRQLIITKQLEGNILSIYAIGMSKRAIRNCIQRCMPWIYPRRRFQELPTVYFHQFKNGKIAYLKMFIPGLLWIAYFKLRINGSIETCTIYNILGIDIDGQEDILSLYVAENARARFWLSMLAI